MFFCRLNFGQINMCVKPIKSMLLVDASAHKDLKQGSTHFNYINDFSFLQAVMTLWFMI